MHDRGSAGMNPEMVWIVVISEQFPVLFELIVIVIIITLVSLCKKAGKEEDRRMRTTERKRQSEKEQKKAKGNDVYFTNSRIEQRTLMEMIYRTERKKTKSRRQLKRSKVTTRRVIRSSGRAFADDNIPFYKYKTNTS